jgi:hypothetical protein
MSIIKEHCIISLQEVVDYEILLEGNPFDVSGVDLLDKEYRNNLEFLVDLAYAWYGEEVIENFKKDNKLTFQCLAKFIS